MPHWTCGILRFLSFIPSAWYGIVAAGHAVKVAKFPVLRHAPYNRFIVPGQNMAAIAGVMCFAYTTIIWVPQWAIPKGAGTLMLGLCDLIVTVLLAVAVGLQTQYLPHNFKECTGADQWQVSVDEPSFFRVLNATATPHDLDGDCEFFVTEYAFGCTVLGMYAVLALCNISTASANLKDFVTVCKNIGYILIALVLSPFLLVRWVFQSIYGEKRFTTLPFYFTQIRQKWKQRHVHRELSVLEQEASEIVKEDQHFSKTQMITHRVEVHQFEKPWLPYDVLVLVSQHLHQIDLVNLGMTCKRMRGALGDMADSNIRLTDKFSRFTCTDSNRRPCWGCGLQTCTGCQYWAIDMNTEAASHAEKCRPQCHSCTTKMFAAQRLRNGKVSECNCHSASNKTMTIWQNGAPTEKVLEGPNTRFVCGDCYRTPLPELMARRAGRDRSVMKQLAMQPSKCGQCKKTLSRRGARFWVCQGCKLDCRSDLHPSWADRTQTAVPVASVMSEKPTERRTKLLQTLR